jgi:hypothetical protein
MKARWLYYLRVSVRDDNGNKHIAIHPPATRTRLARRCYAHWTRGACAPVVYFP